MDVPGGVVSVAADAGSAVVLTPTGLVRYPVSEEGEIGEAEPVAAEGVKWGDMVVTKQPERKKPAGNKGFEAYFERKRKRIEGETAKNSDAKVCVT